VHLTHWAANFKPEASAPRVLDLEADERNSTGIVMRMASASNSNRQWEVRTERREKRCQVTGRKPDEQI
jgi:hypothetical protein